MDARVSAVASITRAREELDRALAEIDQIQTYNPAMVGLVAHALNNYLTVTSATVEMLQLVLRDHKDRDVKIWLEGIGHAADLMQHSVGRLVSMAPPQDFVLKVDTVNILVLMERACEYYRRRAVTQDVTILCAGVGARRLAWGDRVAIAVVAENLLANALHVTPRHGTIQVQVMEEPGYVVVSVRDSGPSLTREQQAHLFQPPEELIGASAAAASVARPAMGLFISFEYLKRMNGDLWCESDPGTGTRFCFRLPAVE
jgi:signal transduction histidine kinase